MSEEITVLKDEDSQRPIPTAWRKTILDAVEALKEGDYRISRGVARVRPVPDGKAKQMAENVESYGAHLISLPEQTWETSACQWMRGYWEVLVDLYTAEEGCSDLVLAIRVFEQESTYSFEIQSLHVP